MVKGACVAVCVLKTDKKHKPDAEKNVFKFGVY